MVVCVCVCVCALGGVLWSGQHHSLSLSDTPVDRAMQMGEAPGEAREKERQRERERETQREGERDRQPANKWKRCWVEGVGGVRCDEDWQQVRAVQF